MSLNGPVEGSCEHSDEPLGSIKCWVAQGQLYHVTRNLSAPTGINCICVPYCIGTGAVPYPLTCCDTTLFTVSGAKTNTTDSLVWATYFLFPP
jgi:hypothetical protein